MDLLIQSSILECFILLQSLLGLPALLALCQTKLNLINIDNTYNLLTYNKTD